MFFSFPHIGIDSKGTVGNISRPGRAGMSCACGAVIKTLGDLKSEGLTCNCKQPGGECQLWCLLLVWEGAYWLPGGLFPRKWPLSLLPHLLHAACSCGK